MVESGNKNKGLFLGVAAAAALVGAALLYHFMSGEDGESSSGEKQIVKELKAAGMFEIKRTPDG